MHTLSRLTGWMILALALASPVAAQTQPAQPPAADPIKEQQERAISQPP